ncbi:hypothetical protein Lste_1812 [Legionella steelei]|uniref:Uncharacterized protein n=1 Tax=Legionella steelei TaxID=947033 RepID=A0A0W0ZIJ6_9GAMM|nr:hypothetical protein [Legionella steelei]KTD68654.1 hypothetical protein Lste_1812 [Legionella steelei]
MFSKELESVKSKLNGCGHHWGTDFHLSGTTAYVGQDTWYETQIPYLVGLNGNNPGPGPGLILEDVENKDIHMTWTPGLTGCMGLAILGRNEKTGKIDLFFAHARQYDQVNATEDPKNPMFLARNFVKSHGEIRVFWGTDFFHGHSLQEGQAKRQEAQRKLSTELGCWVRNDDCIVTSDLTFFPKIGLPLVGSPATAYKDLTQDRDLAAKIAFSESKKLDKFTPDDKIVGKIQLHLVELKEKRYTHPRLYHQDNTREMKITALTQILEAYKVGNYDVLRHYARHAENNTSPFAAPEGKDVWSSKKGTTKMLAQLAARDIYQKISVMGYDGCGLQKDMEPISSYRFYKPNPKSELSPT